MFNGNGSSSSSGSGDGSSSTELGATASPQVESFVRIFSMILLGLVTAYSVGVYVRELYLKKPRTLRANILLATAVVCISNDIQTILFQLNVIDRGSTRGEDITGLFLASFSFLQYALGVLWLFKVCHAVHDVTSLRWFPAGASVIVSSLVAFFIAGTYLACTSTESFDKFFNATAVVADSLLLIFGGIYGIHLVTHLDALASTSETYVVVRRARITVPILLVLGSCAVALAIASLTSRYNSDLRELLDIVDPVTYLCDEIACLLNFLLRVIILQGAPVVTFCYTFASPREEALHLLPLDVSKVKYGTVVTKSRSSASLNVQKPYASFSSSPSSSSSFSSLQPSPWVGGTATITTTTAGYQQQQQQQQQKQYQQQQDSQATRSTSTRSADDFIESQRSSSGGGGGGADQQRSAWGGIGVTRWSTGNRDMSPHDPRSALLRPTLDHEDASDEEDDVASERGRTVHQ